MNKVLKCKDVLCNGRKFDCMVCPLAKLTRLPFSLSSNNVFNIFDLVHGDVRALSRKKQCQVQCIFSQLLTIFQEGLELF